MHLKLYWWSHLVRESAGIRDVVGPATRPWTIWNIVVSLWFFRRCSRVGHFMTVVLTLFNMVTTVKSYCLYSNFKGNYMVLVVFCCYIWRYRPIGFNVYCVNVFVLSVVPFGATNELMNRALLWMICCSGGYSPRISRLALSHYHLPVSVSHPSLHQSISWKRSTKNITHAWQWRW